MRAGPGDALAFGFEGTQLPEDLADLADRCGLGGVILFARNCPSLDVVLDLTSAAHRLGPHVLVLVDHEGGRVHRLPPPFTRFPPAAVVGRANDAALAGAVARAMARELRAAGFDSGLGPVLDVLTDPLSTVIGDRAFGADPEIVAVCGVAAVEAMLAEGLVPVAKHFPGHGRTALDSHVTLPEVDARLDALEGVDLRPFRRALAVKCPALMVGHVRYHALDPVWPASLSSAVIRGLLRDQLGFGGLVLSDDLEMGAVARTWGVAEAATRFLEAGGDLALICRDPDARRAALAGVEAVVAAGRVDLATARARRVALRALSVRAAAPDPATIGCAEHRALAEEVARRGAT